ncbi:MAG: nicotinamide-nucleotide amidohydrolase family protein [Lachnospiraceae bacterium]|nr:nicotinamide-nucleotide amidohydrolase family protein [Lachnospiraceae bacterium]
MEKETQSYSYSKTVKICGMQEKEVKEKIHDLLEGKGQPVFRFTVCPGEVIVRIEGQGSTEEEAKGPVKSAVRDLKIRLGSSIYSTSSSVTLEETIVQLLKEQGMTITMVESCTGGMLSARLTDVAGVSEVFKQGYVTYSNKAKRKLIGVKKMTLKKYTAVSEQTAFEMARGGAVLTGADVCLSVTGYAGPATEEDQQIGLVYIGCNVKGKIVVEEFHFEGDRRAIRELATAHALILLRRCILENYKI